MRAPADSTQPAPTGAALISVIGTQCCTRFHGEVGQLKFLTSESSITSIPNPNAYIEPTTPLTSFNLFHEVGAQAVGWRCNERVAQFWEYESLLCWCWHAVPQVSRASRSKPHGTFPNRLLDCCPDSIPRCCTDSIFTDGHGANRYRQHWAFVERNSFSCQTIRYSGLVRIINDGEERENIDAEFPELKLLKKPTTVGLLLVSLVLTSFGLWLIKFNIPLQSNAHRASLLSGVGVILVFCGQADERSRGRCPLPVLLRILGG